MNRRLFLCDSLLPWGSGRRAKCCADSTGVGSDDGQTGCLPLGLCLAPALPPSHGRAVCCRRRRRLSGPRSQPWGLVAPPWFWTRGCVPDPRPATQLPTPRPVLGCLASALPITPSDFTSRAHVKGDTVKNQGSTPRTSLGAWALLRAAPQGGGGGAQAVRRWSWTHPCLTPRTEEPRALSFGHCAREDPSITGVTARLSLVAGVWAGISF